MTPIEKAKEVLRANLDALCSLDKNQFGDVIIDGMPHHPVMVELVGRTRDALAALEAENPTYDDATEVADKINAICFDDTMGYDSYMAALLIQQYAESYHAKKCAECKANEAQQ